MDKKTTLNSKPKCRKCDGTGVIYSKWDIGNFDLCDRCNQDVCHECLGCGHHEDNIHVPCMNCNGSGIQP